MNIHDAFEDRSWILYLIIFLIILFNMIITIDAILEVIINIFTFNSVIINKTRTFLKVFILYEYKSDLEIFTIAAEIWIVLK